jgi:hypothetical protein
MNITDMKEREILQEYYSFLYDLAAKKNYLHSSQLTEDEKKYCDKLLSQCKIRSKSNELYMPVMKNILRNYYSEKASHVIK